MEVLVDNLRVAFPSPNGPVPAVRGVSFVLGQEKLAIVGESGSGKSLTARAIMRLLPRAALLTADALRFDGIDILNADERAMRAGRRERRRWICWRRCRSAIPARSRAATRTSFPAAWASG
jgi:peptide/nickel transport system ATP-binding protein